MLRTYHGGPTVPLSEWKRFAAVESGPAAPSAEGHFFNNPEKREVRELADTGAVSNDPAVAETAEVEQDAKPKQVKQQVEKAEEAPPTPTDIKQEPGGKEFSTLNRFVVKTEEPVKGLPEGHEEVEKHPTIASLYGTVRDVVAYDRKAR